FYTYNGSTANSTTDSSAVTINSYQLLEAMQNSFGNTGSIYNNGVLEATGTQNAAGNVTRTTNLIGRDYSNSVFFQGDIAEIL
ncbi:LamG-like jellyroll fold domain-containing protein, partial [Alkalihalophilus lindianensis]